MGRRLERCSVEEEQLDALYAVLDEVRILRRSVSIIGALLIGSAILMACLWWPGH